MTTEARPTPEPEDKREPTDLRAQLLASLASQFNTELETNGTLPRTARESLIGLLDAEGPTSADVISALCLEDPTEPEATDE